MTAQETFVTNAAETTLSSSLASGATTINVTSSSAFPSVPFYAVIDPDVNASREIILVDSAKTATTFTLTAASKRGQDGTTDTSHSSGAKVVCVPVAALWTDINDRVDGVSTAASTAQTTANNAVAKAGDTMTGALTLPGAPTVDLHAATKKYVDDNAPVAPEGFRAYRSTTQTITAATNTAIIFDTEELDQGSDYNPATGEWTVPETGWYDVGAGVRHIDITDGEELRTSIARNGTVTHFIGWDAAGGTSKVQHIAIVPMYLTAGDVMTVIVYQSSGGRTDSGSSATFFVAVKR